MPIASPNVPRAQVLPPLVTVPSGPEEVVRLVLLVRNGMNLPTPPPLPPRPKPRPLRLGLPPPTNDGQAATKGVTLRLSLSPF
jgi:hypothetical protein